MDKYSTFERKKPNIWWVHCNGEPLTTYQVTHLLNELTEENNRLNQEISDLHNKLLRCQGKT